MSDLKTLSKEAIPEAIDKAKHYRVLNEPWHAESICLDILEISPDNQEATYIMILAITDQFGSKFKTSLRETLEKTSLVKDDYEKYYCKGLIYERQATTALKRATPRANYIAYDFLCSAMEWYEKAEKIKPRNNDETILRWNSCTRLMIKYKLEAEKEDIGVQPFLDV